MGRKGRKWSPLPDWWKPAAAAEPWEEADSWEAAGASKRQQRRDVRPYVGCACGNWRFRHLIDAEPGAECHRCFRPWAEAIVAADSWIAAASADQANAAAQAKASAEIDAAMGDAEGAEAEAETAVDTCTLLKQADAKVRASNKALTGSCNWCEQKAKERSALVVKMATADKALDDANAAYRKVVGAAAASSAQYAALAARRQTELAGERERAKEKPAVAPQADATTHPLTRAVEVLQAVFNNAAWSPSGDQLTADSQINAVDGLNEVMRVAAASGLVFTDGHFTLPLFPNPAPVGPFHGDAGASTQGGSGSADSGGGSAIVPLVPPQPASPQRALGAPAAVDGDLDFPLAIVEAVPAPAPGEQQPLAAAPAAANGGAPTRAQSAGAGQRGAAPEAESARGRSVGAAGRSRLDSSPASSRQSKSRSPRGARAEAEAFEAAQATEGADGAALVAAPSWTAA